MFYKSDGTHNEVDQDLSCLNMVGSFNLFPRPASRKKNNCWIHD